MKTRAPRPSRSRKLEDARAAPEVAPEGDIAPEALHAHILETALDAGRRQARRLHGKQRALFTLALGGVLLVALRGVAAMALSQPTALLLAAVLGVAVVLFTAVFVWAWRVRGQLEHLLRDIQTLAHVRESLDDDSPPRVEVGPIAAEGGRERPVVVVRNDSMERLLLKDAPPMDARSIWLGRAAWSVVGLTALAVASSLVIERDASTARRWTFVDVSEPAALGLHVVGERSGGWLVEEHSTATGAHALKNRAGDHGSPPAALVAHGIRTEDLRATTRCKVVAEHEVGACGLVFRFKDDANHHVARLDFLQRRLIVSVVSGGVEHVLAEAPARIAPGTWQELTIEVHGTVLRASCNDRDRVEVSGAPPAAPGQVGLWVPATGEAYFDELAIDVLPGPSSTLAVIPMLRKST